MALKRVQTPDLDAPHIRDDRFTAFSNYFGGSRRAGTSFIKSIFKTFDTEEERIYTQISGG